MDNNSTEKQLIDLYNKVPEDIRGILADKNFGPAITVIGKDYGLTALQSLDIEDCTVDVLLGVSKKKDMAQDIATKLSIIEETARGIVKDINDNIFIAAKESIEKLNDTEYKQQKKQAPKIPLINEQKKIDIKKTAIEELSKPIQTNNDQTKNEQLLNTYNNNVDSFPKNEKILQKEAGGVNNAPTKHIFEEKLHTASQALTGSGSGNTQQKKTPDPYREPLE